jgi:tetratricopeptide (TPR) repeat protein
MRKEIALMALLVATLNLPCSAQVSFQQAVQLYNSGYHARALTELKKYEASYPNNALVHYYIALCQQELNHLSEAKAEYQLAAQYGDATLKAQASSGLAQLSHISSGFNSASSRSTTIAQTPSASNEHTKVRKVMTFDADW